MYKLLYTLSFACFLLTIGFSQETTVANYKFYDKLPIFNEPKIYDAQLIIINDDESYYTTILNTTDNLKANSNNQIIFENQDFMYQLLKQNKKFYTHDLLQRKKYFFEENIPEIVYKYMDDTKLLNNIILHKAFTTFRGREYILWFEKGDINISPWKFSGINGIVHEAYSTDGKAKWELVDIAQTKEKFINPFPKDALFLPYELYPEKAYAIPEALKRKLAKNPNNRLTEQERNQLEIEFDFEEK